ncbi:hypothetical protein RDABS01_020792 [Bienertia sinuspersici]
MDATDFVREISKFVSGLPLFGNLSYATTTLKRSNGIIDFLLFLHVAPNLKEVSVTLNYEEGNPLAHMTQLVVVALELLLNNLECVNISGLQENNDEVELGGYILKNATILNELWMGVYVDGELKTKMLESRKNSTSLRLVLGFQHRPQRQKLCSPVST